MSLSPNDCTKLSFRVGFMRLQNPASYSHIGLQQSFYLLFGRVIHSRGGSECVPTHLDVGVIGSSPPRIELIIEVEGNIRDETVAYGVFLLGERVVISNGQTIDYLILYHNLNTWAARI